MTKGIWISTELINTKISWVKKALLSEISQLEMLERGCIASNSHFADKLNITSSGVSKALNELAKDGYILIDNSQSKRNFGRKITIYDGKSAIYDGKSAIYDGKSAIYDGIESKEKKTIKKTIKREEPQNKSKRAVKNTTPTLEEVKAYILDKQLSVEAIKFFDYFEAGNWIDAKGNKVKNWKQKILTWNSYADKREEKKEVLWG